MVELLCGGQGLFLVLVVGVGVGASVGLGREDNWKMMVSPDLIPMLEMDLSLSEISRGLGGKPVRSLN